LFEERTWWSAQLIPAAAPGLGGAEEMLLQHLFCIGFLSGQICSLPLQARALPAWNLTAYCSIINDISPFYAAAYLCRFRVTGLPLARCIFLIGQRLCFRLLSWLLSGDRPGD
jgi:hypothetical protein